MKTRTFATARALTAATAAAQAAGALMRRHWHSTKKINSAVLHDIKLELDVRCQKRIERTLRKAFPDVPVLGEEGVLGDPGASVRWVVDPIDGTVNFAYGIPHACVSIALQQRMESAMDSGTKRRGDRADAAYETVVGVVYDPFCEELWTAVRGFPARLNGRVIRASSRRALGEAVVSVGFAKSKATMDLVLPSVSRLVPRVRKIRITGSAALSMTYVASGRFDAYLEAGVRLWDIAAGGLILECAGGEFWHRRMPGQHVYAVMANNGLVRAKLGRYWRPPPEVRA